MSETIRVIGDGMRMRDVLAWLEENGGRLLVDPTGTRFHPMEPLIGPCYRMQRVPHEPDVRRDRFSRLAFDINIDDERLLVLFKLRWS